MQEGVLPHEGEVPHGGEVPHEGEVHVRNYFHKVVFGVDIDNPKIKQKNYYIIIMIRFQREANCMMAQLQLCILKLKHVGQALALIGKLSLCLFQYNVHITLFLYYFFRIWTVRRNQ